MPHHLTATLLIFGLLAACNAPKAPSPIPKVPSPTPKAQEAPERIVAIGDLHGDFDAARAALRLAGAIDDGDRWIGGSLVVVQTGDQLDRGDGEVQILDLLDRLIIEAREAGGKLVVLNGNHEIMNVQGDMRYVTPAGFTPFDELSNIDLTHPAVQKHPEAHRARVAAFMPGGPFARRLAERDVIAIVGDTVFAHGGVLPEHVTYGVERINKESREWIRGERAQIPEALRGHNSPIWTRLFSDEADESDCATLARTLKALGVARMVVGHTVQRGGVTSACDGRVWRIDVGMARHYGGTPGALEIGRGGQLQVLEAAKSPEKNMD